MIYCDINTKVFRFVKEKSIKYAIIGDADSNYILTATDAAIAGANAKNTENKTHLGKYGESFKIY